MVPLPSHSPAIRGITHWGQLGEILGGVKFPEQTARSGFAVARAWGLANNTGEQKFTIKKRQGPLCPKPERSLLYMRP